MADLTLVCPYFGPFPPYFALTLRSMAANSDVRWVIPTDNEVANPPPNVEIFRTTFDKIRQRFAKHFDFELGLTAPYKLVDFKPAYGELFADEIGDSRWWGHCDLDMIFGQIVQMITGGLTSGHRKLYIRGHLSIYRNAEEPNAWYRSDVVPELSYRAGLLRPGDPPVRRVARVASDS